MQSRDNVKRVLLIGAAGAFGSRLARLLANEPGLELVLAGRRRAPLVRLQRALGCGEVLVLERASVDAALLRRARVNVVADLSGPYRSMGRNVVEAALAARVHYLDIADARDHVEGIRRHDDAARVADVAILSGASSTPALSNAVVDALTIGWQRVDAIEASISPSNSQDYGLSVIQGILGSVGRPFQQFSGGAWKTESGWSATRRVRVPGLGRRYSSIVETPDTGLFVERHEPVESASFRASLELSIMHLGVTLLSLLVRHRIMRSASFLARPLQWSANRLSVFSSGMGGMQVRVAGRDRAGRAVTARWSLIAEGEAGPRVPVLACLIVLRKLASGAFDHAGAGPCTGQLALGDFEAEFDDHGIETDTVVTPLPVSPFRIALGPRFEALPPITRLLHTPDPTRLLRGEVDVVGAATWPGRIVARLFRFPASCRSAPLRTVVVQADSGAEDWARHFPDRCMRSRMCNPDTAAGTIDETFGPFAFTLRLQAHPEGIDMLLSSGRVLGWRMPRWLLPNIVATERADGDRHLFDVSIELAPIGRLVHYRGWLRVEA